MSSKFLLSAIALLSLSIASQADVVITETMSSSGTGGTSDWFEVTNTGSTSVSLSGDKMDDSSATFGLSVDLTGVTTVAAGESVIFFEAGTTPDANSFRTFWGLSNSVQVGTYSGSGVGLSATGDGVNIFDSTGNLLSSVSFGTATAGTSFDFVGTPGLSVLGVHGAYTSPDALHNIASPGVIPEPSTWAMLLIGGLSTVIWQRRRRAV